MTLKAFHTDGLGAFAHVAEDDSIRWLGLFGGDLRGETMNLVCDPLETFAKFKVYRQRPGWADSGSWPVDASDAEFYGYAEAFISGDTLTLRLDLDGRAMGQPDVDFSPLPPARLVRELTLGLLA